MKFLVLSIFSIVLATRVTNVSGEGFCYNSQLACGRWGGQCSTGKSQSPVRLTVDLLSTTVIPTYVSTSKACNTNQTFYLENNGHTSKIQKDMTSNCVINGPIFKVPYTFAQLHAHWGSKNGFGSEHIYNGQSYDGELHLVFYSSEFTGLTEAIKSNGKNALAVIAIFLKVGPHNPSLNPLLRDMKKIKKAGSSIQGTGLNLGEILPNLPTFAVGYDGTLTTPDCNPVVRWAVVVRPATISTSQLEKFRGLLDSHNKPLVDNYRPTQPIHEREFKTSLVSFRRSA